MTTKKDTLSKTEKRQVELDYLMDIAEETSETIKHGKDAHPATLFGYEIHTLEKELEKFGKKKRYCVASSQNLRSKYPGSINIVIN